jgi:hypothetical protein
MEKGAEVGEQSSMSCITDGLAACIGLGRQLQADNRAGPRKVDERCARGMASLDLAYPRVRPAESMPDIGLLETAVQPGNPDLESDCREELLTA